MATRIRLQRHGRKGQPFYQIVVADSRAKRDGKFIENLGYYNPTTVPATIVLNTDRALDWVLKGATPTDTALAILKYKGVMYRKHLQRGVSKGALTEEQAAEKFNEWLADKESRIESHRKSAETKAEALIRQAVEAGKERAAARLRSVAEAEAALEKEREDVAEATEELAEAQEELQEAQEELEEAQEELEEAQEELAEAKSKEDVKEALEEIEEATEEVEEAKEELAEAEEDVAEAEAKLAKEEADVAEAEAAVAEAGAAEEAGPEAEEAAESDDDGEEKA